MSSKKFSTAAVRDTASWVLGLGLGTFITVHETLTGSVNVYLTMLAGFLLGIPGFAAVANLFRGQVSVTLTPEPPPPHLPSPSPPSSTPSS